MMVRINGGTFTMGSPTTEPGRNDDETTHQVTVGSFYMANTHVTQREYQEVTGTNPSNLKWENLPVTNLNWYNALVYCNKLSVRDGFSPSYMINGSTEPVVWVTVPIQAWNLVQIVPGSNGYRLPTEAEWEYACRAGTTTPFSNGKTIYTNQANFDGTYPYNDGPKGEYRRKILPVGTFVPNQWGLYDMHGNAFEWCWDWYGVYPKTVQNDPQGAASGAYRVIRGGSWYSGAQKLRSACRYYNTPSDRNEYLSLRLARSVTD